MKRFNREMWKWTRRIIIAELIFLIFSVIISMQRMPEIEGLEDQNSATSLGTYTSVSNPAEMLNDWDYDCATMSFNGSAFLHDYDFAVPAGYEVAGIRVTAYVAAPSGSTSLYLAIGKDENDTSSLVMDTMTTYGLSCSGSYLKAFVAGGPTDKWSMSWTPAEINNVNFTAYIENTLSGSTIYIDAVYVKVWYYASLDSDTFNMLDTPIVVNPLPAFAWTTIDADTYVPDEATGVILDFHSGADGTECLGRYKARMYGSTDNYYGQFSNGWGCTNYSHRYAILMVGLDSQGRFQFAADNLGALNWNVTTRIIGWTGSDIVYRTNACNLSPTAVAWTTYNVTSCLVDPSDVPKGAILWNTETDTTGTPARFRWWYVRMYGSSDDTPQAVGLMNLWTVIVGIDDYAFQQKTDSLIAYTYFNTYLVGYITGDTEFEASPLALSGCVATNATCDVSSYVPAATGTIIVNWAYSGSTPGGSTTTDAANVTLSEEYDSNLTVAIIAPAVLTYSGYYPVSLTNAYTFWVHQRLRAGTLTLVVYSLETPPATTTTTTPGGTTTTSAGAFDLPNVPNAIGDALGIGADAGGLLLSFLIFFLILAPLGMITKNLWVLLITGLTLTGFLVAIQWLPVWIMVMLCLIVALLLGSRLSGVVSRGGTDEGD